MADEAGTWLTYKAAADRLGLAQPSAVRARARRAGWPKRTRNDTNEAEILVPGAELAKGVQKPPRKREPVSTMADAVAAAVGPLIAVLERKDAELAASLVETAKATALREAAEARAEREQGDRQALQGQLDALRHDLHTAQHEAAQAAGKLGTERMMREMAEAKAVELQRQRNAPQVPPRRWWWPF